MDFLPADFFASDFEEAGFLGLAITAAPKSLTTAFSDAGFTVDQVVARNLTEDQIPLVAASDYPPEFWSWLASRAGFYLMVRAHA